MSPCLLRYTFVYINSMHYSCTRAKYLFIEINIKPINITLKIMKFKF